MVYMSKHLDKYSYDETYNYGIKVIKKVVDTSGIKIKSFGLENIPKNNGFYLCANHQEKFDSLAVWYTCPKQLGVILNDDAIHKPVIRELCKLIKTRSLIHNKMHSILESFAHVTKDLASGENYLVFPEGVYEQEYNTLSNFHSGCFKSPSRAKVPIIPIAIKNSYRIFDKGLRTTLPIEVHYLKPIYPNEYKDFNSKDLANLVRSRIEEQF